MNTQGNHSPNFFCKEQQYEYTKRFNQLQSLQKALKQCHPVSESLLMRLFERVGCNLN